MTFDIHYHGDDCHYACSCCWLLTIADDCYMGLIDDLLIIDDY